MNWQDLPNEACSVARTLAVLGDRWTLLIIRDCFNGTRKFDEFQRSLGISRTIVTNRLTLLTKEGVLTKQAYQTKPDRYEYRLTEKGLDIYPILMGIFRWGDKYYAEKEGSPALFKHKNCKRDFHACLVCSECGEPLHPRDVNARHGPGYKTKPRKKK
ncbi:MAG: helix-turn-helix transcriptional regulator [Gammaproteobacteria bacterium]|nr:helix-turn-helix transcriptional regulator [Gammaproteobacteria bacterium]